MQYFFSLLYNSFFVHFRLEVRNVAAYTNKRQDITWYRFFIGTFSHPINLLSLSVLYIHEFIDIAEHDMKPYKKHLRELITVGNTAIMNNIIW